MLKPPPPVSLSVSLWAVVAFTALAGCRSLDETVVATSSGVPVHFIDADAGHAYLRASGYDRAFSLLDYELRMKTNFESRDAAREAFWASARTEDWSGGERHAMAGVAEATLGRVAEFAPCALPDTLRLVKGTGGQEFGAYHTVDGTIVMPSSEVGPPIVTANVGPVRRSIQSTLAHEVFHVYSRQNPASRDALYALLGFRRADTLATPDWLTAQRVTNPDAHEGYAVTVQDPEGQPFEAALVTYSEYDRYDGYKGFASRIAIIAGYLETGFVGVGPDLGRGPYAVDEVGGFLDRIGDLTDYTIAADEVLADGFERLVGAGGADALADEVSPEAMRLLEGIERVVADPACSVPG